MKRSREAMNDRSQLAKVRGGRNVLGRKAYISRIVQAMARE